MDPIGREAELAALRTALDDATRGVGRIVLISGDPGIGKSTIVDAFRADAEAAGAIWLWGAAWEDAGAPAYWPWTQVVRGATRVAEKAVEARAADLGPLAPGGGSEDMPDQFALYDAVAGLLATLSERAPVVVVLEDLHAAGMATVRVLEFVARFNRHVRLLLIGTYRPTEARGDPELHAVLAGLEDVGTALSPATFHDREIAAVLTAAGVRADQGLVTEVAERTQGNPLFVTHVARRLAAGGSATDAGLPLGLRNALRRQAERAAGVGGVAEALDAAAVLGVDLRVGLLATVLGTTPGDVRPVLDAAAAAGLLRSDPTEPDRYEFAHAVIREALHDGINPARRAELHLLTGHALVAAGAGPDRLGRHFAAAWPAGGAAEAVKHCRIAGQRATAAHAHAEAVASFLDALTAHGRLPDADPHDRCALLVELAAARFRAGRSGEAHDTARLALDLAESLDDVELAGRAVLLLASNLPFNTVDHDVLAALLRSDERWGDVVSPTRAAVLARRAGVIAPIDRAQAAAVARRAEEVAVALGDDVAERDRSAALASALTAQLEVGWGAHDPADARVLARRLSATAVDPGTAAAAAIWETVFSLELGHIQAAEESVRALERLAARERQPALRHLAVSRRAMMTILRGDVERGIALSLEARTIAAAADLPDGDAVAWGQLFAAWSQGALGADETTLMERIATHLAEHSDFAAAHAAAVVQMLIARGDVAGGRALFERTIASLDALERDLLYLWTITLLADDAVALGEVAAGSVLYDRLLPFAARFVVAAGAVACLGSASHALGRLALLLGRPDAARRHFQAARDAHVAGGCSGLAASSERALADIASSVPSLEEDGQVITARYGRDVVRLPVSLGLRYLKVLILNPGVDLEATRLVALTTGPGGSIDTSDAPVVPVRPADEVLDRMALTAYRARLVELDAELDEATAWHDEGRIDKLEEERALLVDELSRAVGLGGRRRRFTDESERARVNVTRAIRSAIRKLEPQAPELAAHLDQCVTTGGRCRYDPPTG